jgi:hypothetical protein
MYQSLLMGDSPDKAAHYHFLGFKFGAFISDPALGCVQSDNLFQILFWYSETAERLNSI